MKLYKRIIAFTVSASICAGYISTQPVAEFFKENIFVQKVFAETEEET